ncbi:Aste57867_24731 [Aphanomyces stellatus]|uniref:Aste57867_24731 protein n=1 Tax=Aphanomyces stellatus TaxID=120398 RepID=A0A485LS74_9STRA|nr:hypothetical protein As57867_024653 [Aphanomyces stellatus]VFU01367.1 Aste57867_24731 [Aphanomyces stellatus]
MVADACDAGFPSDLVCELWRVLTKHDVWRLKFDGRDPPTKVRPLKVTIKEGAEPYRCKGRKHNAMDERFLDLFGKQLLEAGVIHSNPQSEWCSPVNPVLKPEGRKMIQQADRWSDDEVLKYYRLTNDYRVVNSKTNPKAGTMPFQVTITSHLKDKKAMGTFDMPKCFWQFPLDEDSRDKLSFLLNDMVMTPAASCKATWTAHSTCSPPAKNDILVYASTATEYVRVLEKFLDRVDRFGFKLCPTKTTLFTQRVKWCGRILNASGVSQDPERIEALCAVPVPTNAGDLQQFICATNWLRDSIIEYAQTVDPLQKCLTKALDGKQKRKRIAASIQIELTSEEQAAFEAVKSKLRAAVELSHPRDEATMCLFTDASDNRHPGPQVRPDDTDPRLTARNAVIEKEAYPIARACDKLNHLLLRPQGFRMYCDHENLIEVFAPNKEWKAYKRAKLTRWAAIIGGYRYTIEHIKGVDNLWADLMSRWGQPRPAPVAAVRRRRTRGNKWSKTKKRKQDEAPPVTRQANVLRPLDDPEFAVLKGGQDLWMVDGRIWVPSAADLLIQRIMVVAHCGSMGHRGQAALSGVVARVYWMEKLQERCKEFVRGCLLCPHVKGGKVIHRPYAPRWHASQPNEGLHFDFLYMGQALKGPKYLLVLKDDLSHYCELVACDAPTGQARDAEGLDQRPRHPFQECCHGRARVQGPHEFTLAYCPWRNGTVERLNRDILQVMRVLLLEYKLADHQWDYLVPVVQANLNQTPVATLMNKSPLEVFQAREPVLPMDMVLDDSGHPIDRKASLRELHKEICDSNEARQVKAFGRTLDYNAINAEVGDYVLWSRVDEVRYPKLLVTWIGPYKVVEVNEYSAKIEHLATNEQRDAHTSRLKMYADASFNITEEILEHVSNQGVLLKVERITATKFDKASGGFLMQVYWGGFEDIEASWEPMKQLAQDCPAIIRAYVDGLKAGLEKDRLAKALAALLKD